MTTKKTLHGAIIQVLQRHNNQGLTAGEIASEIETLHLWVRPSDRKSPPSYQVSARISEYPSLFRIGASSQPKKYFLKEELKVKLAPSILSADFARLGEQVAEVTRAGADYIHVDVMDGHFVPQITIGAPVVAALRSHTRLPLDVHLMIADPEHQIKPFADAGADIITVHIEACPHIHRVVQTIRESGAKAGVALNPGTPVEMVTEILPSLDLVLVMTVNPGFGGQTFIEGMLEKIARVRAELDKKGWTAELEVDGGITAEIAPKVVQAGARILVAGAAVFNSGQTIKEALDKIRASLD